MEIKTGDWQPFNTSRSQSAMTSQLNQEAGAMRLRIVESDIIYAVGYAESSQMLVILSNQGKIYRYFAVPQQVYEELVASNAVDSYLRQFILGHYACVQVRRRGRKRHR